MPHPTQIIGYAYEGDTHCPECTRKRFVDSSKVSHNLSVDPRTLDQHGLPWEQKDSEGNMIAPVFHDQKFQDLQRYGNYQNCSDCGETLA